MGEKGTQVAIGLKRNHLTSASTQTPAEAPKKDQETQCGLAKGSYGREREHSKWRYDDLIARLHDKEVLIQWLMVEGLLAKARLCSVCGEDMKLVKCDDRSDGFRWECRRQVNNKRHKVEISVRKGSWFEHSNMTMEEILKFTYWWCQDLDQAQIRHELGLDLELDWTGSWTGTWTGLGTWTWTN